ncbi:hypothetical protein EV361DRAFT_942459 [Lentinula raphanica]|nr:hypothetical protein EV361DRAFT_942459 [Lentinula raphanica]
MLQTVGLDVSILCLGHLILSVHLFNPQFGLSEGSASFGEVLPYCHRNSAYTCRLFLLNPVQPEPNAQRSALIVSVL